MKKKYYKIFLVTAIISLWVAFYYFGGNEYLNFSLLRAKQNFIQSYFQTHKTLTILLFCITYILATTLSIPVATVLTLAGGVIFGVVWGTIIIVISATIGATLALLSARFIAGDFLEKRYAKELEAFNQGLKKNAFNYLLFLRLVPLFPFFIINICMGLTRIRISTFFFASLIGMIPGTFVYCNASKQLASLQSIKDITSPNILIAFALLGTLSIVPLIIKKLRKKK
jgi:uncharacterized membrane protein YdjX (TVP38/TMEM64 family)